MHGCERQRGAEGGAEHGGGRRVVAPSVGVTVRAGRQGPHCLSVTMAERSLVSAEQGCDALIAGGCGMRRPVPGAQWDLAGCHSYAKIQRQHRRTWARPSRKESASDAGSSYTLLMSTQKWWKKIYTFRPATMSVTHCWKTWKNNIGQ